MPDMRYEKRLIESGWAVWDKKRSAPGVVEGCPQIAMHVDEAGDLADILNRVWRKPKEKPAG
jgi:hypothetical protein